MDLEKKTEAAERMHAMGGGTGGKEPKSKLYRQEKGQREAGSCATKKMRWEKVRAGTDILGPYPNDAKKGPG